MDLVTQMQRQFVDYKNSLFREGFLDDQFKQLLQLQDESNPDFVFEVVSLFFEDSNKILNNLATALQQQIIDYNQVDAYVHQFKGSSSSIGAVKVRNECVAFRSHCEEKNHERATCKKAWRVILLLKNYENCFKGLCCSYCSTYNDFPKLMLRPHLQQRGSLHGRSIPRYLLTDHVSSCNLRISCSVHRDLSIKFQSHRSRTVPGVTSDLSPSSIPFLPPATPAWSQTSRHQDLSESDDPGNFKSLDPADLPICSFAAAGDCPRGEGYPHIHVDICPFCGRNCLHRFRPQEREEHMKTCEKKQKKLEPLKHSQEIECSVWLEHVLSKPTASERKFGTHYAFSLLLFAFSHYPT